MHIVKIEETFDSSIEDIWNLVTDLNNQLWRSGIDRIEIIDSLHFKEYDKSGFCTEFVIMNKTKNEIYEFNLKNENIEGFWTGKFIILDDKRVKIEFTESLEVKKKIMNLVAKAYLKKQQKQYIEDLKKALKIRN